MSDSSALWDIIDGDDCFWEEDDKINFTIRNTDIYMTNDFKIKDHDLYNILFNYLVNLDNLQTISVNMNEKSAISRYYETIDLSELSEEHRKIAESCIAWLNARNNNEIIMENYEATIKLVKTIKGSSKNKYVLAYKLLKYLLSTANKHCVICGCITDASRQVCHRIICVDIACNKGKFKTSLDNKFKRFIYESLKAAWIGYKDFLKPEPVLITNDNLAVVAEIYSHMMLYNFKEIELPEGRELDAVGKIPDGYSVFVNTDKPSYEWLAATEKHTPINVFHGSPLHKWISILRGGLVPLSGSKFMSTGAAYGPGVYFSKDINVSISYLGYSQSNCKCLAICKVIEKTHNEKCPHIVIQDPEMIYIAYLLVSLPNAN